MNLDELKTYKFAIVNPRYIKKNYLELFNFLNQQYPHIQSIAEKLYWWQNDLEHYPTCPVCGKPTGFINFNKGYRHWCSYKCMNGDKSKQEKTKQTCLEKYGVDNPRCVDIVKEKARQTCLEKYGVDNPAKSQIIKRKIEETNLIKYGVKYISQVQSIKDKSKQTKLERYGDPHYTNRQKFYDTMQSTYGGVGSQSDIIKRKVKETNFERYGGHPMNNLSIKQKVIDSNRKIILDTHPNVIGYTDDGSWVCKCPHSECNKCAEKTFIIKPSHLYDRIRGGWEICTNIHPINSPYSSIELWVRDILDSYNIEYESNTRHVLNGKELDIYIPSHKLAIECNGVYWHSDKVKNSTYHSKKFEECLKQDIQLITLWEDQIKNKPDIVKSVLLSKLGIYTNRFGARLCEVRKISNKESRQFLEENHIQGPSISQICLGLYYQDSLYGVMTFSKRSRYSGSCTTLNGEWELTRFCTKINTQIIGAASKLIKYFIRTYNPLKITSFSSNDISNGGLYQNLGFHSDMKITRAYWYINENTLERFHRSSFSKSSFKRRGVNIEGKTETELMKDLPYLKVYDSGHIRWEWTNVKWSSIPI